MCVTFREGWEQRVSDCCDALCCLHVAPISVGTICLLGTFFFLPRHCRLQEMPSCQVAPLFAADRAAPEAGAACGIMQLCASPFPFRDLDGVIALAQLHLGCGHRFWSAPGSWLLTLIYANLRTAGNYMHVLVFRKFLQSPRSGDSFVQHQENELFILMGISDTLGHVKRPACVLLLVMEEGWWKKNR